MKAIPPIILLASTVFLTTATRARAAKAAEMAGEAVRIQLPRGRDKATVPLVRGGSFLFVRVKIQGRDAGQFLLDIGSSGIWIDRRVAGELGLSEEGESIALQLGGNSPVGRARVTSLEIGEVKLADMEVICADLTGISDNDGVRIDGILGAPFVGGCPCAIDPGSATLTFFDRARFQPPRGAHSEPLRFFQGRPAVKIGLVEGIEGWFLVDTGLDLEVAVGPAFTKTHPRLLEGRNALRSSSYGGGGLVECLRVQMDLAALFGRAMRNRWTTFQQTAEKLDPRGGADGLLGEGILGCFRLTFDFPASKMWVEESSEETARELPPQAREVNAKDAAGWTALMRAIWQGQTAFAKKLVSMQADLNAQNNLGVTALILAAQTDEPEIVRLLLEKGADANKASQNGATPLIAAAQRASPSVARLLFKAGAEVNAREAHGTTALLVAANGGRSEIVRFLLKNDADPGLMDKRGTTPLMAAAGSGNTELIEILTPTGAEVKLADEDGQTALFYTLRGNHVEAARLLLRKGADLHAKRKSYGTVLIDAASYGHLEMVRLFLEKGADVNAATTDHGMTALIAAVFADHLTVVEALLAAGANVNATAKSPLASVTGLERISALSLATLMGRTRIAEALQRAGARE